MDVIIAKNTEIDESSNVTGNISDIITDEIIINLNKMKEVYIDQNKYYTIVNNKLPLFLSQYYFYYSEDELVNLDKINHKGIIMVVNDLVINDSIIDGLIVSLNGTIRINNSLIFSKEKIILPENRMSVIDDYTVLLKSPSPSIAGSISENDSDSFSETEIEKTETIISDIEKLPKDAIVNLKKEIVKESEESKTKNIITIDGTKVISYDNSVSFLLLSATSMYNIYTCKFLNYHIYVNVDIIYNVKKDIRKVDKIYIFVRKGSVKKTLTINPTKAVKIIFSELLITCKNNIFKIDSTIEIPSFSHSSIKMTAINQLVDEVPITLTPSKYIWKYTSYVNDSIITSFGNDEISLANGVYRLIQWEKGVVNISIINDTVTMLTIQTYHKNVKFNEKWQWIGANVLKNNASANIRGTYELSLATNNRCLLRIQGNGNISFMSSGRSGISGLITGIIIKLQSVYDYRYLPN